MTRTAAFCGLLFSTLHAFSQWTGGPLTMVSTPAAAHPRPPADIRGGTPPNDLCENAVITTLPYLGSATVTGDNTGATDTEDFGNPNAWEAFTIDTCSTVTVSYCGTQPVHGVVYSILIIGCPGLESVQNNGDSLCTDGNAVIRYENLAAGTYYVPVLLMPGTSEGPYTITFTSEDCDLPPLNDRCSTAQSLTVVQQCGNGSFTPGNNTNTVIDSPPTCTSSTIGFKDVWYVFDSGDNTEVLITIDPGTMTHTGVEVRTNCNAGSQVFCASDDTSYTVSVLPNTAYRVRVFTNRDSGLPGTFGICISSPTATAICDGGALFFASGDSTLMVCASALGVESIDITTSSVENYILLVTDTTGQILSVSTTGSVDLTGLIPGEYQVWGLSYAGDLSGANPGAPLAGITSSGDCLAISAAPLGVMVDICQGLPAVTDGLSFGVTGYPDGRTLELSWRDAAMPVIVRVVDMRGEVVYEGSHTATSGGQLRLPFRSVLTPGLYAIHVSAAERRGTVRWVVR
jgi:hypothetical protein